MMETRRMVKALTPLLPARDTGRGLMPPQEGGGMRPCRRNLEVSKELRLAPGVSRQNAKCVARDPRPTLSMTKALSRGHARSTAELGLTRRRRRRLAIRTAAADDGGAARLAGEEERC